MQPRKRLNTNLHVNLCHIIEIEARMHEWAIFGFTRLTFRLKSTFMDFSTHASHLQLLGISFQNKIVFVSIKSTRGWHGTCVYRYFNAYAQLHLIPDYSITEFAKILVNRKELSNFPLSVLFACFFYQIVFIMIMIR